MAKRIDRYLLGLPRGGGRAFLSWRLLADDPPDLGFEVERRAPGSQWQTVSASPVTDSTNFMDQAPEGVTYEYRVVALSKREREPSATVAVDAGAAPTIAVVDAPLMSRGASTHHLAAGELLNDGRMGFVCTCRQDGQLFLDAYACDGRHLWRRPLGYPTNINIGHTCGPYLAWDVNHDGRTEVVCRRARGGWEAEIEEAKRTCPDSFPWDNPVKAEPRPGDLLCALDGETGEAVWEVGWPGETFEAHMTLGYVRGMEACPALVIHDGRPYGTSRLYAMDGADGSLIWQVVQDRPSGHNLDVGDIDEDGVQEVICGGVCYNGDGTVRWEAEPFGHTDISKPARIDPSLPGLQVYFAVESRDQNPGVYFVDKDGRTIFKEPFRHAHYGWIVRHTDKVPGLQPHTAEDARAEHGAVGAGMREVEHNPIFLPDGSHWLNLTEWQRKNFVPVQWDEGPRTVFIIRKEHRLVRLLDDGGTERLAEPDLPPGGLYERNLLCADLLGDYRENVATVDVERDRLLVLANPEPAHRRGRSPYTDFYYRHDRSQHGSGYYIYVAPPLTYV